MLHYTIGVAKSYVNMTLGDNIVPQQNRKWQILSLQQPNHNDNDVHFHRVASNDKLDDAT
jgi:hypothetical protein